MCRSNGRLFIGLGLLLIGAAFLLRNLNVFTWEFEHYYLGWPTIFFLIGLLITISSRGSFFGFSLMAVGVIFFASRYYNYPVGEIFHDLWPVFLILFGLSILFKRHGHHHKHYHKIDYEQKDKFTNENNPGFRHREYHRCNSENWIDYSDDTLDLTSMFSENKRRIISQNFKRAKVTTLFASTELDFNDAKPAASCIIECDTIFGGTEIIVPSNWQIVNQTTAIFGGADDKRRKSAPVDDEKQMKITIKGFTMFGGIEIKS